MLPTRLNLISEEKRKILDKTVYLQSAKHALEILLIGVSLSVTIILGGWLTLQNHINSLTTRVSSGSENDTKNNEKIKEINQTLLEIDRVQSEYVFWMPIIKKVSEIFPERISISSLKINTSKKTLIVSGVAGNREDLLNLRKILETESGQEIKIPLSQLVEKENIQFNFELPLVL